jgi:hypothetical protein
MSFYTLLDNTFSSQPRRPLYASTGSRHGNHFRMQLYITTLAAYMHKGIKL